MGRVSRLEVVAPRDSLAPHSREWRNWQTRRIQVPVSERMWGFKSPLAHSSFGAGLDVSQLGKKLLDGDRPALARAITLVESRRPDHRRDATDLMQAVIGHSGNATRLGITGVPGVGKSTFIDQFGLNCIEAGQRIAVLAVDPTSSRTGGSILGDKTRMERLARDPRAFIRPSPAGRSLGGVNRVTRESILLCEAAGYDTVIVETVGVGQSETLVSQMVDCFLVLLLPGAGDDLQGIKKGIIEMADILAVNKSDGDGTHRASAAAAQCRQALHLLAPNDTGWTVPVLTCSGLDNVGLDTVQATIDEFLAHQRASGRFETKRAEQQIRWMWDQLDERVLSVLHSDKVLIDAVETDVRAGALSATAGAERLWDTIIDRIARAD